MKEEYSKLIADQFRSCVTRTISRIATSDSNKPFHEALLSETAIFWSRFERSFSTSFGQRTIEEISKISAEAGGATKAERQHETIVHLDSNQLSRVNQYLSALRGQVKPEENWGQIIDLIRNSEKSGNIVTERVISDLYWEKSGVKNYMSIKTVKPNIDQTVQAKRDLMLLSLNDEQCNVFFGLYYNPYGEERSSYAHTPPQGIFDFMNDDVVLIGKDYWDKLGGKGHYEKLLNIADEVGEETRPIIEKLR